MGNEIINGIKKRDGTIEEFDMEKISQAIIKAGEETGEFGENEGEHLAFEVVKEIRHDKDNESEDKLTVEYVQDTVEHVLLNTEYKATAKALLTEYKREGDKYK